MLVDKSLQFLNNVENVEVFIQKLFDEKKVYLLIKVNNEIQHATRFRTNYVLSLGSRVTRIFFWGGITPLPDTPLFLGIYLMFTR